MTILTYAIAAVGFALVLPWVAYWIVRAWLAGRDDE